MLMQKIKILIISTMLILSSTALSSSLSFMIKDDKVTESYLKIKNKGDPVYLKMYCNNFINDIEIKIVGSNHLDFMAKNIYSSKVIFGKNFSKEEWKLSYNESGKTDLVLKNEGIEFVRKLYNSGRVLVDLKELKQVKLFTIKNKKTLQRKLDSVFENCGIYF